MTADEHEAIWQQLKVTADDLTRLVGDLRADIEAAHVALDNRIAGLEKQSRQGGRMGAAQVLALVYALAIVARLLGVELPLPPGGP